MSRVVAQPIKLAYGVGQLSKGIEHVAMNVFLLFFYSQVLGLSSILVGAAMGISLLFDAVSDPLVGSWSDSLRHRWGRRHPLMYAAAVPFGLAFAALFSPPSGLTALGCFAWVLCWAVLSRLLMTVYFVPHLALGAELSEDYDERTRLVGYRVFFSFLGAGLLIVVARGVFFAPSAAFPNGQMDASAYPRMGMIFGFIIAASILLSAFGTRSQIPRLRGAARSFARMSAGRLWGEVVEAMANRSFRSLVIGMLFFFVARGTALALEVYMGTFFWKLGSNAVALPGATLLGILIGTPVWSLVARRVDKRFVLVTGMSVFCGIAALLPTAKLLGVFPDSDSAIYLPLLFGAYCFEGTFGAAAMIAGNSMLADIADEHELNSGRRQEGLFFGGVSFARKAATGGGALIGGVALAIIELPTRVEVADVDPAKVQELAVAAGPGVAFMAILGVWFVTGYQLTRSRHAEIQRLLGAKNT